LQLFLKWHHEITVRKAQGLSTACGLGSWQQEVDDFFTKALDLKAKWLPNKPQKDILHG
jgi:hypothetical protein